MFSTGTGEDLFKSKINRPKLLDDEFDSYMAIAILEPVISTVALSRVDLNFGTFFEFGSYYRITLIILLFISLIFSAYYFGEIYYLKVYELGREYKNYTFYKTLVSGLEDIGAPKKIIDNIASYSDFVWKNYFR